MRVLASRQLGQMLTAGALRGVLPAGVLSVDDADRLTQASLTPARTSSNSVPPFVGGRELDGTDISTQKKRPWCRVHDAHPRRAASAAPY